MSKWKKTVWKNVRLKLCNETRRKKKKKTKKNGKTWEPLADGIISFFFFFLFSLVLTFYFSISSHGVNRDETLHMSKKRHVSRYRHLSDISFFFIRSKAPLLFIIYL